MNENFKPSEADANWSPEVKTPEVESKIDFEQMEKSFADGSAGEYYNNTGALPVEAFLEEQGDERAWREISSGEQGVIKGEFTRNVDKYNLKLAQDETSLMAHTA